MNYTLRNLVVASLLMLIGIVAVISFIRSERQELSRGKQEVQVYVATKDIPVGTPADELQAGGYLDTRDVLREDAPPDAVGKLKTIEGLVSNDPIYVGNYVTYKAFDKTAGLKPTAQIKGNERLFAVPIQASMDAAGLIRAGDRVDIMACLKKDGGGSGCLQAVIARDVEVIETPVSLKPGTADAEAEAAAPEADGKPQLYVLKATDEEWQNIAFANAHADDGLQFGLRPASGDAETKLQPMSGVYTPPSSGGVQAKPGPDPAQR